MRRARGFTLIELLVVIAIIAILAAILFPVFAKAKDKANQAACTSNLRQLGLGVLMYVQDNDERLPRWDYGCGTSPDPYWPIWYETIQPYLKNAEMLECPSDSWTDPWSCCTDIGWNRTFIMRPSYCMNEGIHCVGPNISQFKTPANLMLLAEARLPLSGWPAAYFGIPDLLNRVAFANSCGWDTYCAGGAVPNDDWTRHNGGSVICFADGHAKWLKWQNCNGSIFNY
jgi:prepilin-type N-terminal cleavage/methylation domain-containing protein/prepilin-type processing-associated H-X9-DG protein